MTSHLLDLPNEILFSIFEKLDNMNVLYSLMGIGVERLDLLAQHKTFTDTLNFVLTDPHHICSVNDSIFDRFCNDILPRIQYSVRYLIVEATTAQRILLAADYPNLTKLKIFEFNQDIASRYVADESTFGRIFKPQITDLILISNEKYDTRLAMNYTRDVYARIVSFCENLKYLHVGQSCEEDYLLLSFRDLPSTTFFSLTLTKLSIDVYNFDDCLSLLDGRLKQLTTLIVTVCIFDNSTLIVSNSDDLPNLKCFSFTYIMVPYQYDTQIVPLLRRMCNLEKLRLYIGIDERASFVDGTHLHNEILIHMPQLHTFIFYIRTKVLIQNVTHNLSDDDIQRTFINIGYEQVGCIVDYFSDAALCHVFSLPFAFHRLDMLGNKFPNITFNNVTVLLVMDFVPFKHEFFVRIARSFPLLKSFRIINMESNPDHIEFHNNQSCSTVEYRHLTILDTETADTDYVEQLLNESTTRLPQLKELKVQYDDLEMVTENFTRDATRLNCSRVERLIIDEPIVYPKDFYLYFPLLSL